MNDLILADTNIFIYLLKGDEGVITALQDKMPVLSVLTEIELLSFPDAGASEVAKIKNLISDCRVVQLDEQIKNEAIVLKKNYRLKTVDSIVAATAKYLNIILITADKSFTKLDKELAQILIYKP